MNIILKPLEEGINARINPAKGYIILNINNINEDNIVSTLVHEYVHYSLYWRISKLAYNTYDNISKKLETVEITFNELFPVEEEWNSCCYCNAKLTKSGLCPLCDLQGISDPDDEDLFF